MFRLFRRLYSRLAYAFFAEHRLSRTDSLELFGLSLDIPPTVFHPGLYFSSKLLAKYLTTIDFRGKKVLDIGSGSGIQSLVAAYRGAHVTSIDLNPDACQATRDNATRNHLDDLITVYQGNLFEPIPPGITFDYILLNPPFYSGKPTSVAELAWYGGTNSEFLREFTRDVSKFLRESGEVILVISSEMDLVSVYDMFRNSRFRLELVRRSRVPFEQFFVFRALQQP